MNVVNLLQHTKMTEQQCQCLAKAPEKRRRIGCPSCTKQGKVETWQSLFLVWRRVSQGCWLPEQTKQVSARHQAKEQTAVTKPGSPCRNYTVNVGSWNHRGSTCKGSKHKAASELEVFAISADVIPFSGWVEATVSLPGHDGTRYSIQVPFLVSQVQLERPLLGFNVISELFTGPKDSADILTSLYSLMSSTGNTQDDPAEVSVGFIHADKVNTDTDSLRVGPRSFTIHPGQAANVKSRVPYNFNTSDPAVLFEPSDEVSPVGHLDLGEGLIERKGGHSYIKVPVGNHTKHDMIIPKRAILGEIATIGKIIQTDQVEPSSSQEIVYR